MGGGGDQSGQISRRRARGTSAPRSIHSLLTLDRVDVSPPELHGAQPLLAVVPQSPQVSAGAPPQLTPAAELPGLSETLRSDNNTRCVTHFQFTMHPAQSG